MLAAVQASSLECETTTKWVRWAPLALSKGSATVQRAVSLIPGQKKLAEWQEPEQATQEVREVNCFRRWAQVAMWRQSDEESRPRM